MREKIYIIQRNYSNRNLNGAIIFFSVRNSKARWRIGKKK